MGFQNVAIPAIQMSEHPLKNRLIPAVLVGVVGKNEVGLYLREYIRLVDKAVYNYEIARQAIMDQRKDTGTLHFLAFIDHFENCINALARLGKLLDGIKRSLRADESLRALRKRAEAASRVISGVRNEIEHMDKVIAGHKSGQDLPVMLMISEDGRSAVVGTQSVRFRQVAEGISAFHRFGLESLEQVCSEGSGAQDGKTRRRHD